MKIEKGNIMGLYRWILLLAVISIGFLLVRCGQPMTPASPYATLSFNKPATNNDGTVLNDLTGYRLYDYLTPGSWAAATVRELGNSGKDMVIGTIYYSDDHRGERHYYSVTAVNSSNVESDHSNEVSKTL